MTRRQGNSGLGAVTKSDAATLQIVRRELYSHHISQNDLDKKLAHFAGYVSEDKVIILQPHPKERIGKHLDHFTCYFDRIAIRSFAGGGISRSLAITSSASTSAYCCHKDLHKEKAPGTMSKVLGAALFLNQLEKTDDLLDAVDSLPQGY
jgi:hypothetical protein